MRPNKQLYMLYEINLFRNSAEKAMMFYFMISASGRQFFNENQRQILQEPRPPFTKEINRYPMNLSGYGFQMSRFRLVMSNLRPAWGPVEGFVQPRKLFIIVHLQYNDSLRLFLYLKLDIFVAISLVPVYHVLCTRRFLRVH